MSNGPFLLAALLFAVALSSCSPPPTGEHRILRIESRQELDFGEGAKAIVWNLRGEGIQKVTANMVMYRDGERMEAEQKLECAWMDRTQPKTGQVAVLLQTGTGKHLRSLAMSFHPVPFLKTEGKAQLAIPDDCEARGSRMLEAGTVPENEFLYTEGCAASKQERSISLGDLKSLAENSRNGKTLIGVTLRWE